LQIKKLDDTEFRNAFGRAYIRVGIVARYGPEDDFCSFILLLTLHLTGEGI
jgi:hypothetical protein